MPFLRKLNGLLSRVSPFQKILAPPVSNQKLKPKTFRTHRSRPNQPASDGFAKTPTSKIRKRKWSPGCDEQGVATAGCRPFRPNPFYNDNVPCHRSRKRARLSNGPFQTIERDPVPTKHMSPSGATKPANNQQEPLIVEDWKRLRDERLAEVQEMHNQGWRQSDIELFKKIGLRGFDPLLPLHWMFDFPILPDSIFAQDAQGASIRPMEQNPRRSGDFRASKALWSLIELGPRVRDDIMLDQGPQHKIGQTFTNCLRWAVEDANIGCKLGIPPMTVICTASEFVNAEAIQRRLNERLAKIADAWQEMVNLGRAKRLPSLYGIVISHAVWAILAYVPEGVSQHPEAQDDPNNFSVLMSSFNFAKANEEVWVAFAFALFAVHCRDELVHILEKDEKGVASDEMDGILVDVDK